MQIRSVEKESSGKFVITLEIESDQADSFLSKEEKLADLLNQAGCLATAELLKQADSTQGVVHTEQGKYYQKGVQKKSIKPPMAQSK